MDRLDIFYKEVAHDYAMSIIGLKALSNNEVEFSSPEEFDENYEFFSRSSYQLEIILKAVLQFIERELDK